MNVATHSMKEAWKGGMLEQNSFKCLLTTSCCLMSHSNKIVYMIILGEVRMYFVNCLARWQVVQKDRTMGHTAQYKLGDESVVERHWLRMSEIFFVLIST